MLRRHQARSILVVATRASRKTIVLSTVPCHIRCYSTSTNLDEKTNIAFIGLGQMGTHTSLLLYVSNLNMVFMKIINNSCDKALAWLRICSAREVIDCSYPI